MAQLPPKVPNQNWPPTFPLHQRMPPLTTTTTTIPTTSPPPPPPPPQPPTASAMWADEFLDFTSARRGTHRRSMSDSIAFLESPLLQECRNSLHAGAVTGAGGFDRLDDEVLMSMFNDDISGGGGGVASPPSDQNSNNDDDDCSNHMSTENNNNNINNTNNRNYGGNDGDLRRKWLPKSEPGEAESDYCNNNNNNQVNNNNNNNNNVHSSDNNVALSINHSDADPSSFDPKRVKRILANRQSAQRSRVRKLQYISELERSVTSLQTEVSTLSPRVAYLDHQRLILNVDNSAIKQRIAALAQDKIFKDAHQEALKKEIDRLRQVYHHQQQQQQHSMKMMGGGPAATNCGNNTTNATVQSPISDHNNMDCADKEQLMT